MKQLTVMIKPASSLCNLRCKYCFYRDAGEIRQVASYGVMSFKTADRLIENIFRDLDTGDQLNFCFQGGEPTIAGLDFFRHFLEKVDAARNTVSVSYALQTNGTLLDAQWMEFLAQHKFLVGLSMDAGKEFHDLTRVDDQGRGTFKQTASAQKLLERYGVPYNILTVLTRGIARHPRAVWNFIRKSGIRYIQFIPCLGSLEPGDSVFALEPESFGRFYTILFQLWLAELQTGNYISVKLFDDVVNQLAFGAVNACGLDGQCRPQIVVEADGGVYPCDFYALDQYRVGNLTEQSLAELFCQPRMEAFQREKPQLFPLCRDCRYYALCGGGCKRMRQEVFCAVNERSCGYRMFLDECFDGLCQVAQMQRRMRSSF